MPIPKSDYCITPSQLDAFQAWLDAEALYNSFYGFSEEPPMTIDEYCAQLEKRLIDQINRCPKQPIEAADRGTCFNEVVDMLIADRPCTYKGMTVQYCGDFCRATLNGFTFDFDIQLCQDVASRYPNAISQHRCEALLDTPNGKVLLYGFLDEWCGGTIYDIKTTTNYTYGKFQRHWQRYVYPYCVLESGEAIEVTAFEYTAIALKNPTEKSPIIKGDIYPEIYLYNHEEARVELVAQCDAFIFWLNCRREFITDKRIFGGVNPDGYVGTPVDVNLLLPSD
jgi:hypothetical protein